MIGIAVYMLDGTIWTDEVTGTLDAVEAGLQQQLADDNAITLVGVETTRLPADQIQRWAVKDMG